MVKPSRIRRRAAPQQPRNVPTASSQKRSGHAPPNVRKAEIRGKRSSSDRGPSAGGRWKLIGASVEEAVVNTVMVTLAELVPSRVTLADGENEQLLSCGNPEQLRVTFWLKPPVGETWIVKMLEFPADTVDEPGLAANTKSEPVPVRGTV